MQNGLYDKKENLKFSNKLSKLDLIVYPYTIYMAVDCADEYLKEYFNEDIPPLQENQAAQTLNVKNGILIRFGTDKDVNFQIIIHETIHAALYICDNLGININSGNQEPFAFLVDCIADFCHKFNFKPKL